MPKVGLSNFMYAQYDNNQGTVSYSGGGSMGEAVNVSVSVTANNNEFYADNHVSEVDKSFQSGTVSCTTKDLTQTVSKAMLGLHEEALGEIDGITDTEVKELIYDDQQVTPSLGMGFIETHLNGGVYSYRAIMLCRVAFDIPADEVNTRGESIEWQTPTVSGTIMRSEEPHHRWKQEATFTTIEQAIAYLKNRLSIT